MPEHNVASPHPLSDTASDTLAWVWEAIRRQPVLAGRRRVPHYSSEHYLRSTMIEGWLPLYDFRDIMQEFDQRLIEVNRSFLSMQNPAITLASMVGCKPQSVYDQPRRASDEAFASEYMRATELCSALLKFRHMGFESDPQEWTKVLKEDIVKKSLLTRSELDLIWAHSRRRRFPKINLGSDPRHAVRIETEHICSGAKPYASAHFDSDDRIVHLSFSSSLEKTFS